MLLQCSPGLLLVLLLHFCVSGEDREGKLLNVFTIINFPNDPCTSGSTSGVCYTATECSALGGTTSGSCASGFGVCCLFTGGCGATASVNNTYFASSSSDSSPCTFTVCKCNDDICQLRLNFDTFQTSSPFTASPTSDGANPDPFVGHTKGQCLKSQFQVYTDGPSPPTICGTNTGYHMIVDAADNCNQLSFTWTSSETQSWNIQVMQIPCTAEWRPPEGCLQYFTGATGTIQSYNYAGKYHLASQKYSNCIRTEQGYCSIAYSAVITASDFSLSGTGTTSLVQAQACNTDYVLIDNAGAIDASTGNIAGDRFCGAQLNTATAGAGSTVFSQVQPFIVSLVTDAQEADIPPGATGGPAVEARGGINLAYAQTKC